MELDDVHGVLRLDDADGPQGQGIYAAPRQGTGFASPRSLYVPDQGTSFDAFGEATDRVVVSRCFDDLCASGPQNGFWKIRLEGSKILDERKLPQLPYGWGGQPVASMGIFVYTDGEDILAVPLNRLDLE